MGKYYTIPFHKVGEDEPRLALMIPAIDEGIILPSPNWFVPASHFNTVPDIEWAHIILDEM